MIEQTLQLVQNDIHQIAVEHGWWDSSERNVGEAFMLMVSEISEAMEYARKDWNAPDDKIPQFTGVEAELADCIIRILDFAGGYNLNVVQALLAKMEFNRNRPYKHGGKLF